MWTIRKMMHKERERERDFRLQIKFNCNIVSDYNSTFTNDMQKIICHSNIRLDISQAQISYLELDMSFH